MCLKFFALIFLLCSTQASFAKGLPDLTVRWGGVQAHTKKISAAVLAQKLKLKTVHVQDPNLHRAASYEGYEISEVISLALPKAGAVHDEIEFSALDGFKTSVDAELSQSPGGIIAIRELNKTSLPSYHRANKTTSFAPYYVVWRQPHLQTGEAVDAKSLPPYPYQLSVLSLIDFKSTHQKILPNTKNPQVMSGFKIFKTQCLQCHMINQQGGAIGPELNIPKNITEYWNDDVLKAFILNTADFRMNSKMPVFKDKLSTDDVQNVWLYLSHMKENKR